MPKKHGFKKQTKVESPEKTPKQYNDYIYNIGDELKGPDLNERIERFEATYPAKRQEYHGFSFMASIRVDGQTIEKEIAVPAEVARSIHAHCEFSAHPITANQKLQPNYVKSNVRDRQPSKVGNLKVSAVGYFNRVQQHIGLPNYTRIKAQTIQKELFKHNLMYKDVGKRKDYPAVADLDYSEQTFARMKKELSNATQFGPTCGGSRLMENKADQSALRQALPHILQYAPDDVKERNKAESSGKDNGELPDQNDDGMQGLETQASRGTSKGKNKKSNTKKQKVRFTMDDDTSNVRRSPRINKKASNKNTEKRGASVKRTLAQVYDSSDDDASSADSDSNSSDDNENDEDFDLFASAVKQDWSDHPRYKALMETGMVMIKQIGFMSPKAGQTSKKTVKGLAKLVGIKNLPSRTTAEPLIVRAMAIERIKKIDPDSEDMYSDLNADNE